MKITKTILTCSAILLLQSQMFAKIEANDISKTLKDAISKTTVILQNSKDKKSQVHKIYEVVDPMFDYTLMAKLSLGFKAFKSLTPSQQKTFVKAFENKLKNSFVDNLKYYSNQELKLDKVQDIKGKKVVKSKLMNQDKPISIDYKFYNAKSKGWLIYDVEVLGTSIIKSYRKQLANIFSRKSFTEVIDMLQSSETK